MLSRAAAENHLWVVGGSIPELDGGRVYNTSYVFAPDGRCAARHRKMHLFDIDVDGGQRFRESDTLTAGDDVTVFDTPWGKMGLCICFDLRFQELSRLMTLAGAQDEAASYVAWGHSIVCDPWGAVLHQCGAGEEVAVMELDMAQVSAVRRQLPILSARRTDIYEIRKK